MKKIIYDFGANTGDNIPYYLLKADIVVAVEANPLLCDEIKRRYKGEIQSGNLIVENFVLHNGESTPKVAFYSHKKNHVLSRYPKPENAEEFDEIYLPAKNVIELIREIGDPYYIKIDLESYDHEILAAIFSNNIFPPYISAESHTIEVFSTLVSIGKYKAFKLVDGLSVSEEYLDCSVDASTGATNYSFPFHSAGPFGNDIKGPWMNSKNLFNMLAQSGLGWKDIHASNADMVDPECGANNQINPLSNKRNISFVTVCKGRLNHVKETLPKLIQESPNEIIFVDYSCPENSGDYVSENFPSVKVIKITDDDGFCLSRARNLGAAKALSDYICFMDADINVRSGFVNWIRQNVNPNSFYRHEKSIDGERDRETWGTFIIARDDFNKIGGYDEVIRGWGGEDDDIYMRLKLAEVHEFSFPHNLITAINHDDLFRTMFHKVKSKKLQGLLNTIYLNLKIIMLQASNSIYAPITKDLDYQSRLTLHDLINNKIKIDGDGEKISFSTFDVRFIVPRIGTISSVETEITIKFQPNKKSLK